MLSRALILAAVLSVVCALSPGRSLAQENLDAGKTPSQIFAGTCNACHKSPRGLLKTVSPSSLPSFLRQHYTTSPNMAGVLSSYLVSNGAADTRLGDAAKGAKGAKEGTREGARQEARQRPETDAAPQANTDGHKGAAKQKWSKRGKPEEPTAASIEPPKPESLKPEPPKAEAAKPESPRPEAAKSEGAKPEGAKPEGAKGETASGEESNKPESSKPAEEGRSQSAKVEQPAETSSIRPDPVPAVRPAPASAAEPATPQAPAEATPPAAASPSPAQASITPAGTEMAVPLPPSPVTPPSPPAETASAPPLPPVPPAGPPAPPISQ